MLLSHFPSLSWWKAGLQAPLTVTFYASASSPLSYRWPQEGKQPSRGLGGGVGFEPIPLTVPGREAEAPWLP